MTTNVLKQIKKSRKRVWKVDLFEWEAWLGRGYDDVREVSEES